MWLEAFDSSKSVDDLVEHGQTRHIPLMFKDGPVQSTNHVDNTCCVSRRMKQAALLWTISILEVSFV